MIDSWVTMNVPLPNGQRARVVAETYDECRAGIERLKDDFAEDDDRERWPLLRALVDGGRVVARVHPGVVDESDVLHVYLHAPENTDESQWLSACALVTWDRVMKMLAQTEYVFETASFQIMDPGRTTTDEVRVRDGLLAWMDRVLPGCESPAIDVEFYKDSQEEMWAHAPYADSEEWSGSCATREEAILEGFKDYDDRDYDGTFYVARAKWNDHGAGLDVDTVIDNLLTYVGDNFGDFAYEAVESHLTDQARLELQALLKGWSHRYLHKRYWTIDGTPEKILRADVPGMNLPNARAAANEA